MSDKHISTYAVLLAGGTGTRLWPVSRELYPKQLVNFIGEDSLVQSTVKRLTPTLDAEKIRIVCGDEHFHEITRHIREIGVNDQGTVICEPCGRNTAPAILLAVLTILKEKEEEDAVLCVFPADHVIRDVGEFQKKLKSAIKLADMGHIVTFGIKPNYPETGYGYIEGSKELSEGAFTVKRFVEKPDRETAEKYLRAGNFFWNSGMFAFKASVILEEFKAFHPELLSKMEKILSKPASGDRQKSSPVTKEDYEQLENISIDYAIMEKTEKGAILPSDFGWSDIGSWKSLYDFLPKDENNNVIDGDVISKDTENCFIMGRERLIATNCISNMVVVETPDSVFVSDIDNSRDVKSVVEELKQRGREEYHSHKTVHHPWGTLTLLEAKDDFQISRIIIDPGSVFEIEADGATVKHLTVIRGVANIGSQNTLSRGEATIISGKGAVKIENLRYEPLYMMQIRMAE